MVFIGKSPYHEFMFLFLHYTEYPWKGLSPGLNTACLPGAKMGNLLYRVAFPATNAFPGKGKNGFDLQVKYLAFWDMQLENLSFL